MREVVFFHIFKKNLYLLLSSPDHSMVFLALVSRKFFSMTKAIPLFVDRAWPVQGPARASEEHRVTTHAGADGASVVPAAKGGTRRCCVQTAWALRRVLVRLAWDLGVQGAQVP